MKRIHLTKDEKTLIRQFSRNNAVMNLISRVAQQPEFWHAAL